MSSEMWSSRGLTTCTSNGSTDTLLDSTLLLIQKFILQAKSVHSVFVTEGTDSRGLIVMMLETNQASGQPEDYVICEVDGTSKGEEQLQAVS